MLGKTILLVWMLVLGFGWAVAQEATTYIATFSNATATSARVVMVVQEGRFNAYVCSLNNAFNLSSARWFEGDLTAEGGFNQTSPDGVVFRGSVGEQGLSGTVLNTPGKSLAFAGPAVEAGVNHVGLYKGESTYGGRTIVMGAVVSPDGSFASSTQFRGEVRFVTPVDPTPTFPDQNSLLLRMGKPLQEFNLPLVTRLK
jgi:hypothetical protein